MIITKTIVNRVIQTSNYIIIFDPNIKHYSYKLISEVKSSFLGSIPQFKKKKSSILASQIKGVGVKQ